MFQWRQLTTRHAILRPLPEEITFSRKTLMIWNQIFIASLFWSFTVARRVVIRTTCDNSFSAWFAGQAISGNDYGLIYSITADINPGNYLVALQASDWGGAAGVAVAITIDGVLAAQFDTTGNWKVLGSAPAAGWNTDINYSESGWIGTSFVCGRNPAWAAITAPYDGVTSEVAW